MAATEHGTWWTGPPGDRRRYAVSEISSSTRVFRARSAGVADEEDSPAEVALKQLGTVARDVEDGERARLEVLRTLAHPHLARALDVFRGPALFRDSVPPEDECDILYTVASWEQGETLWARRDRLDGVEARALLTQIAEGLSVLHSAGLVHGDVHPGNIVVDTEGRCVLIDLGSVARAGTDELAEAGVVGFTPPEVQAGRPAEPSSDGWQLAMVTVQLLVGHPLGRGEPADLMAPLQERFGRRRGAAATVQLGVMLANDPADRPADVVAWATQLAGLLDDRPRAAPRRLVIGAVAVGAAALVLLAGILTSSLTESSPRATVDATTPSGTSGDPATSTSRGCPDTGGDTTLTAEHEALLARWSDAVDSAALGGCVGTPEPFVNAVAVPITRPSGGGDVVVLAPSGDVVQLSARQWDAYREIAGHQRPENAADLGGYPVSIDRDADGVVHIELSGGGVMIGVDSTAQPFWIPEQLRALWEESGGIGGHLGFPASNPYFYESRIMQDFEHAEISTTPDAIYRTAEEIDFDVIVPPDPRAPLEELGQLRGRILRQRSGVAWLVDDRGVRHWIPDGETFYCVGGDQALVPTDLPGYAIWTLPRGEPASCRR